jgi:hypothetical protein
MTALKDLTVKELRKMAVTLGVPVKGTKEALLARIAVASKEKQEESRIEALKVRIGELKTISETGAMSEEEMDEMIALEKELAGAVEIEVYVDEEAAAEIDADKKEELAAAPVVKEVKETKTSKSKWTPEAIMEVVDKCKTYTEFRAKHKSACYVAWKAKGLEEIKARILKNNSVKE